MVERRDVAFPVEGGTYLRGWLFVPERGGRACPAVSMAHGYAGTKEHGLERFARRLDLDHSKAHSYEIRPSPRRR
jgi:cephalosporin-C deacetylase-like acetyl esterase